MFCGFMNAINVKNLKIGLRFIRVQREEYLLLSSDAPFRWIFLKIKDEVRPELVNPPPTKRRFRLLYGGESVYIPTNLRLEPDIPFSEFQKIFDPQLGTSMIFGKMTLS